MKTIKTFKVLILTGLISVFLFSCSKDDPIELPLSSSATISINIAKTSNAINHYLWAYVYAENERDINNPNKVVAVMYKQITSDTTGFTLQEDDGDWMPNGTNWIPTANVKYDMYIYSDSDDDGDPETGPTIGKVIGLFPNIVSTNGVNNQILSMGYYDSGDTYDYSHSLDVILLNADSAQGHYLWATIYNENETDANNPAKVLATMFIQIDSYGYAKITLQESNGAWEPNGTKWLGEIGETYDIYVYTDSDDDNNPATGPTVGKIINPLPQTIFIKGKQSFEIDYNDMVDYVE
jgi:hypothetical protein